MSLAKNKLDWCLRKAEQEMQKGEVHRGLVQIAPNTELARDHLRKAEHNLRATLYLQEGGFTDWCSSGFFYTIYHCFLAILKKFGYESRNQECTFIVIANLIEEKKIPFSLDLLEQVSILSKSQPSSSSTVLNMREEFQYGTKITLEEKKYEELLAITMIILDKTKEVIEHDYGHS